LQTARRRLAEDKHQLAIEALSVDLAKVAACVAEFVNMVALWAGRTKCRMNREPPEQTMIRSIRQAASAVSLYWARHGRERAFRPLVFFAVVWALGAAAIFRLDLAVVDFLGHAKDMSSIHGAVADSPATYVTPEGSTIDAASLKDLHDEDTAFLHGARNHLIFVLAFIFVVPIVTAGLLAWTPRGRPTARRARSR
jgi:hypothetical protein